MRWRPIKADKMCIPHTVVYSDPKEPFCMPRLINKIVHIRIYYAWPTLIAVPIFPDGAINGATSRLTMMIIFHTSFRHLITFAPP